MVEFRENNTKWYFIDLKGVLAQAFFKFDERLARISFEKLAEMRGILKTKFKTDFFAAFFGINRTSFGFEDNPVLNILLCRNTHGCFYHLIEVIWGDIKRSGIILYLMPMIIMLVNNFFEVFDQRFTNLNRLGI